MVVKRIGENIKGTPDIDGNMKRTSLILKISNLPLVMEII